MCLSNEDVGVFTRSAHTIFKQSVLTCHIFLPIKAGISRPCQAHPGCVPFMYIPPIHLKKKYKTVIEMLILYKTGNVKQLEGLAPPSQNLSGHPNPFKNSQGFPISFIPCTQIISQACLVPSFILCCKPSSCQPPGFLYDLNL